MSSSSKSRKRTTSETARTIFEGDPCFIGVDDSRRYLAEGRLEYEVRLRLLLLGNCYIEGDRLKQNSVLSFDATTVVAQDTLVDTWIASDEK